jgi:hypothetical protein
VCGLLSYLFYLVEEGALWNAVDIAIVCGDELLVYEAFSY